MPGLSITDAPDVPEIMQRVRAGLPFSKVGSLLGVSRFRVQRVAQANGYNARLRIHLTAMLRAERRAKERARRDALGIPDPVFPQIIPVPTWAERAGLTDDYRDHTREFGEDVAARHCRALLTEQRRQDALDASLRAGRGA